MERCRGDVEARAIRGRFDIRFHASRSSHPPRGPLLPRGRGARVGPTLPPPCAPLCSWIAPAHLVLFGPPWGPCAPPGLLRRPGAIAVPAPWGSLHCCEAFFSFPCLGAFPASIVVRRNSGALWPALLFPPMAGCPCRAPAGAPSPAPGGPLLRRSPYGRHSGVPPGGFFRLARCLAVRVSGGFPSVRWPEVCPPAPLPERPRSAHIFCPIRGLGDPCRRARGLRPCAPRGGRARRPPAPPAAPTRGAVFFIVFCFLRFCNFGALSALHRIKKHKLS